MDFKTFALIAVILALSTLTMGVAGHVIRRNTPIYGDVPFEGIEGIGGYYRDDAISENTEKFVKPTFYDGTELKPVTATKPLTAAVHAGNKTQADYEALAEKLDAAKKRYLQELEVHKKLVAEADAANQELTHALRHARDVQCTAIDAQKSLVQAEQNVKNVDQFLLGNSNHYDDLKPSIRQGDEIFQGTGPNTEGDDDVDQNF